MLSIYAVLMGLGIALSAVGCVVPAVILAILALLVAYRWEAAHVARVAAKPLKSRRVPPRPAQVR